MRFQPTTLSLIQRQGLFNSLAQIQYTNRQRLRQVTGECCHLAARIASRRNATSLPTTSLNQQVRCFDATGSMQRDDSPTISRSTILDEKEKEVKSPSLIAPRSASHGVGSELPDLDNVGHDLPLLSTGDVARVSPILKRGKARPGKPNRRKRITGISNTTEQSSRQMRHQQFLDIMFAPSTWLNVEMNRAKTKQAKVEELQRAIERLHLGWKEAKEHSDLHPTYPSQTDGLPPDILLSIGDVLTDIEERCRKMDANSYTLLREEVAKRLHELLDHTGLQMNQIIDLNELNHFHLQCLRIQAWSFEGKASEARESLGLLLNGVGENSWLYEDLEQVKDKMIAEEERKISHPRLHYLSEALGSVLQEGLNRSRGKNYREKEKMSEDMLEWMIQHPGCFLFNHFIFTRLTYRYNYLTYNIRDQIGFLDHVRPMLDRQQQGIVASSNFRCLIRAKAILKAYEIYRWARKNDVPMDESTIRALVRSSGIESEKSFIVEKLTDEALENFNDALASRKKPLQLVTCRVIAMSHARRANEKKLEEVLDMISQIYEQDEARKEEFEYLARLCCYSRAGNVERAAEIIEKRYDMSIAPDENPRDGLLYPDYHLHARLVQTYLKANQIDQAEATLHRMVHFGYRPNTILMNGVLQYYAEMEDLNSVTSLFQQMINAEIKPNRATYTILISFFAKRKDVEGASNVFKEIKKNHIRPDGTMYNALLNAHVESSNWKGATSIFSTMLESKDHRFQPSPATYNLMLKAHVLRSLPVQEVFSFFKSMIDIGMEPDEYTFTLILQSVTDAGFMDLAEHVFTSLEKRLGGTRGKGVGKGANIYHFTLMIHGYLRLGQLETAREYVSELRERGHTADGILWGILVKAYAARDEGGQLDSTREMVRGVQFEDSRDYAVIYQPLIQAYSKRANVEKVETLLQELTDKDAEIPLNYWSSLLDAFRTDNNVEGAMDLWNMIFDKALEVAQRSKSLTAKDTIDLRLSTTETSPQLPESRRNILCIPLSILIDILTKNGMFERIAQEWLRCRKAGFAFDSHNWNHLCTSFIKAGRLRDAVKIIELVLNSSPPSREWGDFAKQLTTSSRIEKKGSSSRVELVGLESETKSRFGMQQSEMISEPARPPNRRHEVRVKDDLNVTFPLEETEERLDGGGEEGEEKEEEGRRSYPSSNLLDKKEREYEEEGENLDKRNKLVSQSILKYLYAQAKLERKQSPWFAHFETMVQLNETVQRIRLTEKGVIELEDETKVNLNEFLQEYPRVEELLGLFQEKVEAIQEMARIDAVQGNLGRRGGEKGR